MKRDDLRYRRIKMAVDENAPRVVADCPVTGEIIEGELETILRLIAYDLSMYQQKARTWRIHIA